MMRLPDTDCLTNEYAIPWVRVCVWNNGRFRVNQKLLTLGKVRLFTVNMNKSVLGHYTRHKNLAGQKVIDDYEEGHTAICIHTLVNSYI